MKKYELNAKGMACPLPVVKTKKLLEEYDIVETMVDNLTATENLTKLAEQMDYDINVKKISNEEFIVTISDKKIKAINTENDKNILSVTQAKHTLEKENEDKKQNTAQIKDESYIVVINKNVMGHGNDELGGKLIKAFLYTLTEQEVLPKKIIFYNGGALLVDRNRSHVLKELKELEDNGVEIVCCGACIDFYKVDLAIGNSTNMYFIVEDMRKANKIVQP